MGWLGIASKISSEYLIFLSAFSQPVQKGINLLFLILIVFIYAIFVWKFHKFISKKNILNLDLNQYNRQKHPIIYRILAFLLFVAEYFIVLPLIVFVWFGIFSIFLLLLSDDISVGSLIIISATVIGAIRFLSYVPNYGSKLAKEVAKLFPLTLLAVGITTNGFFNFERILEQISKISSLFDQIGLYLLFIVIFEIILRFFDYLLGLMGMKDDEEEEDDD